MGTLAIYLGQFSIAVLLVWIISFFIFRIFQKKLNLLSRLLIIFTGALFILFIPVYRGVTIAILLRGFIGDLSITTTLLIVSFIYGELLSNKNNYNKIRVVAWLTIFIIDLILCLSAIGYIPIDIYSTGYQPKFLLLFYLIMQFIYWRISKRLAVYWLIGFTCYLFKILPSNNLWDYLIDPIIWIMSIWFMIKYLYIRIKDYKANFTSLSNKRN